VQSTPALNPFNELGGLIMKSSASVLLVALCLSATAFATAPASTPLESDRVELAPGLFGILHTENFEYVCDVEAQEDGQTIKFKSFLDVDFPEGAGYRFAAGFPGGGSMAGVFAVEIEVTGVQIARCPGLCLSLKVKADDAGGQMSIDFMENPVTKVISVSSVENGVVTPAGTCARNEVP